MRMPGKVIKTAAAVARSTQELENWKTLAVRKEVASVVGTIGAWKRTKEESLKHR